MTFIVRPATAKDAPLIAAIHVNVWRHAYRGIVPDSFLDGLSVERRTEQWSATLSQLAPGVFVWVADDGGDIVGFCSLGPSRDDDAGENSGELGAIYVLPSSQRTGIGSALVERGLAGLANAEFNRATLWVLARNVAAQQFYERLGWRRDGGAKTDAWQGIPFDEVRYSVDIRQPSGHS